MVERRQFATWGADAKRDDGPDVKWDVPAADYDAFTEKNGMTGRPARSGKPQIIITGDRAYAIATGHVFFHERW